MIIVFTVSMADPYEIRAKNTEPFRLGIFSLIEADSYCAMLSFAQSEASLS